MKYLIILLLLMIPVHAFGNEADIREAGAKDLQLFLNAIPEGHENLYGFSSRDDFAQAELGKPIPMLTLNQDDYSLVEVNEWRLPVLLNRSIVSFLTVSRVNEQWQAVEIGASGLAREISGIQDVQAILRLYSLKFDFVMLSRERFLPLQSASIHLTGGKYDLIQYYTLDDIVKLVKEGK